MSEKPLSWLKKVETAVAAAAEIPMWGAAPPFPVAEFGKEIGKALSLGELVTEVGKAEWRAPEDMRAGLGLDPLISGIELTPIETPIAFLIPGEDAEKLSRWALDPSGKQEGFVSHEMQKGFYRYLLLHLLRIADKMKACEDLTPKLTEAKLPEQTSYAIDIALRKDDETVWARIICPPSFHSEYKMHFASHPPTHHMAESTLPVTLALTAGSVEISQQEWGSIQEGDFLVLDQCTYHPKEKSGSFLATLSEMPLFLMKSKNGAIKILDYADYFEDKSMTEESDPTPEEMGQEMPPQEEAPQEMPPQEEMPQEMPEAVAMEDTARTEKMVATHDVPLSVTVEVARLSITLNKLLALQPGNTLDLAITPEKGVNLTVNGKIVGRGELMQIGETLGVQITEVARK